MLPGLRFRFKTCAGPLPTAVATISTIAIPAASTAAPSTTPAAPSTASASAKPATTAPTTASTAALPRWPRFVDDNIAAHEIMAVQSLNGTLGFLIAIDFDESEPARLA
jgi:hypothetical protein